jgi:hypothetical protein
MLSAAIANTSATASMMHSTFAECLSRRLRLADVRCWREADIRKLSTSVKGTIAEESLASALPTVVSDMPMDTI